MPGHSSTRPQHAVRVWWGAWWPVVAVAVPIVVAAGRAAFTGWIPIRDDAYFTARSRDVLTANHPWLGAWSSGSNDLAEPINNLGPLQLDLLAPFTKFSPTAGTAVGVAFVQIAAIVAIGWLIRRLAGRRAILPAMLGVGLVTWTMGSENLITPQQHQYLVLPFVCLLVAGWGFAAGDRWALVAFVATGSLLVQTHLTYVVLVGMVALPAAGGHVVAVRWKRASGSRGRPWIVSTALALLLWLQPLYDQLFGWHNMSAAFSGSGESDGVGLSTGLKVVASALVGPATVVRPGFATFDPNESLAGRFRVALLIAAIVALVVGALVAFRRRRLRAASGLTLGATVVVAAIIDAALLPPTFFGLPAFNYRWLWSIGTFLLIGIVVLAERSIPGPTRRVVRVGLAIGVAALAVATVPRYLAMSDPDRYLDQMESARDLTDQLRDSDLEGPVLYADNTGFANPFDYTVLTALQELGVDFHFEDPRYIRRFGDGREVDGTERGRLVQWLGEGALARADAPNVVAFVDRDYPVAVTLEPMP